MKVPLGRKIAIVAAVAGIGLASVGCQQQGGSTPPGSTASSAAAQLPGTAWARADYAQVKDGGQLTLQISQLPDNWNSDQADGALFDLTSIRYPQGYNTNGAIALVASEDGSISFNPDYVVSAELTSKDPQIVTVKFNPKAVWQDGTPITINDLKAEAAACSGDNPAYQVASTQGWSDIKEVRQTTDQFTGEIEFTNTYVDWQPLVYPSIPASISSDPDTFNKGYADKPTPSEGPYMVSNVDTNGQVITLTRNPKWWGQKGKLDTITFKVVTQAQSAQAFANGEVDAMQVANGNDYATAKGRADAELQKTNGLTWTHVTLNTTRGALGDAKVRQAIALAINRELIGQAVVGPFEVPVSLVNNAVFLPGQKGYQDSYNGAMDKQDPAKAEQLLKDDGFTKGSDGVYAKDGQPLAFSITVPADTKSNIDRATQIQKDLNAIGLKIDLQTVPSDQYFKTYISPKNFDMVTFSWVGTLFPIQDRANLFSPVDSEQNYTGYANPKVADLNKQANSEFDPAKRIDLANQMSQAMLGDYTIIPFYATPNVYAVKKGLANYGAYQFETIDWTKVGWTA